MVTEKCLVIFIFVVNIIFLTSSCVMLVFEVQNFINPEASTHKLKAATQPGNQLMDISGIVVSSVKIVISIVGLSGALLRNRCVLYTYIPFLALDILFRIALILFLSFSLTGVGNIFGKGVLVEADNGIVKVFESYGNNVSSPGMEITKEVDEFMKTTRCCSWRSDATINQFVLTQWFKVENSEEKKKAATDYKPQTLPASCCTSHVIQTGKNDECIRTTDMAASQKQNLIHYESCLKLYMNGKFIFIYCMITAHSVTIVLNVLLMIAAYYVASDKLRYIYEEDRSNDSSHSSDYY